MRMGSFLLFGLFALLEEQESHAPFNIYSSTTSDRQLLTPAGGAGQPHKPSHTPGVASGDTTVDVTWDPAVDDTSRRPLRLGLRDEPVAELRRPSTLPQWPVADGTVRIA